MITMTRDGIQKNWKPEDVEEMQKRGWELLEEIPQIPQILEGAPIAEEPKKKKGAK